MQSTATAANAQRSAPRFGKYRVLQRIASGGMADIFLAVLDGPSGFSKHIVLKRIRPEFAELENFSRMFINEARVAALLSHANIVQVFDFGRVGEQHYLAMEWVPGASLERLMRSAASAKVTLGPRVAVEVGIAVADALGYAHTLTFADGTPLSLVHRDVTPGNVLVSRSGAVKLTDFGIVKTAVNVESTVAGMVKGKYPYMSPEQITNKRIDHRSDLFSLGIVLWELCTGRRLFQRESIVETVFAVTDAKVPRPSEFVEGMPGELERIILRLLAKSPDDRYASGHEVMAELEAFRASQGWTAGGTQLAQLLAEVLPPGPQGGTLSSLSPLPSGSSWQLPSASDKEASPDELDLDMRLDASEAHVLSSAEVQVITNPGNWLPRKAEWWLPVTLAAAAVGTAVFWFLVG